MAGLVEQLLELEGAKHRALMACDATAYEESVKSQLQLLNTAGELRAAAEASPAKVEVLSRLIRLNTHLLLNHFSASPAFAANGVLGRSSGYTATGARDARPPSRFSVDV
jgi:hypothetical protein